MTKISFIVLLFSLSLNSTFAQKANCQRVTIFGNLSLCLPNIKGYEESYSNSNVKELADATEVPANRVLGFYLNKETFKRVDSLGEFSFDDYFKVYGTRQIENYEADKGSLKEMYSVIEGNFISKNWENVEKEIDKIGLDLEIGVPIMVKSYYLNENTFSFVLITKYQPEGEDSYTLAMTMNGLLIKNRLVWVAYYLNYNGDETITLLQKNSDRIIKSLLESNL